MAGAAGEPPVVLDAAAGPPSAQVHDQLLAHVASGRLAPGDRLPTVRALAAGLGVSTATVAKAYRRLEEAGVTAAATRAGTVVSEGGAAAASSPAARAVEPGARAVEPAAAAAGMARAVVVAGLDDDAAHELLAAALAVARRP